MTPQQHPELTRADQMLRFFKQADPGKYPCSEEQSTLIKKYWRELHAYTGEEFAFSEDYKWIRKGEAL